MNIATILADPSVRRWVKEQYQAAMRRDCLDAAKRLCIPATREQWAALSQKLGVKVIHVAERDTQVSKEPKKPKEPKVETPAAKA